MFKILKYATFIIQRNMVFTFIIVSENLSGCCDIKNPKYIKKISSRYFTKEHPIKLRVIMPLKKNYEYGLSNLFRQMIV